MPEEKDFTLEEGFEKLEEITKKMEEPKIDLEERFELYKSGIDLIKKCTNKIDLVEKSLKLVNDDGTISEGE